MAVDRIVESVNNYLQRENHYGYGELFGALILRTSFRFSFGKGNGFKLSKEKRAWGTLQGSPNGDAQSAETFRAVGADATDR